MNASGAADVHNSTLAVLFVEDEEQLRRATSKLLRRNGLPVVEAEDGLAALDLFRQRHAQIGVVILDWTLPGLPGPRVLTGMRAIQKHVRVIVTTGHSREVALAAVAGDAPWAFIQKPYAVNDLIELVRASLV